MEEKRYLFEVCIANRFRHKLINPANKKSAARYNPKPTHPGMKIGPIFVHAPVLAAIWLTFKLHTD